MAKSMDKSQLACTESHVGAGYSTGSANCFGDGQWCGVMMMACFSNLLKWVPSRGPDDKLFVSVNRSFYAVSHLLRCVLNGLVRPIRQTMTRQHTHWTPWMWIKGKSSSPWHVRKQFSPYTFTHASFLDVRPILISALADNGLVNEVRRARDQRLMQLMVISGWSRQWCSNKVNISWDTLPGQGRASLCARTLSLQSVSFCMCGFDYVSACVMW